MPPGPRRHPHVLESRADEGTIMAQGGSLVSAAVAVICLIVSIRRVPRWPEGVLIIPYDIMAGQSTTWLRPSRTLNGSAANRPPWLRLSVPSCNVVSSSWSRKALLRPCLCLFRSWLLAPRSSLLAAAAAAAPGQLAPPSSSCAFPQECGKYKYGLHRILRPTRMWRTNASDILLLYPSISC